MFQLMENTLVFQVATTNLDITQNCQLARLKLMVELSPKP